MSDPESTAPSGALRHQRAFVQFWIARIASGFAFQMLSVAVGWQIYSMTHRALDLGLIGLAQFVPSLLFALPAGHVADQFERRRVVVLCQAVECIAIALLTIGSVLHLLDETLILALVFIIGAAKAFEFPPMQAMVPGLVPERLLPQAMAASASASQIAMIAGPAVGGLLYAFGPGVVYGASAALCLAAMIAMSMLRCDHTPPRREAATLKTVFAGVTFIRARPVVLGVISLDLFTVLFGGATALLPIFAQDILHTGPWGLGLLRAAPAAGFGVATLVFFAWSTTLWLSMAALLALGAFDMVSMVIRGALVQLETPDDMRGRVSAVNANFINTSNPLGEFESGLLAAWLGAVPATLIGGIGTLLVVGIWAALFPSIRRRRGLRPVVVDIDATGLR